MDELMQSLFNYIIDNTLENYCEQTSVRTYSKKRDANGRKLWEQLPQSQREELEDLQRAYDRTQMAELEAMYLATFDQIIALYRPHTAAPPSPASPLQGPSL